MNKIRILPLLVLVAFFTLIIRFGEFMTDVRQFDASSIAATPSIPDPQSLKPEQAADEKLQLAAAASGEAAKETASEKTENNVPLGDTWSDPASAGMNFDGDTDEILEELMARRRDLEIRERQIEQREALLQATESQVDQKLGELKMLREELRSLLDQQSTQEESRIKSLVKIYEGMKPKEAANIFNTLDMDIMLSVVSRMSERKSAPILAAMDPTKARALTVLLAEDIKLPDTSSINE